jgi:hypothetical protein
VCAMGDDERHLDFIAGSLLPRFARFAVRCFDTS